MLAHDKKETRLCLCTVLIIKTVVGISTEKNRYAADDHIFKLIFPLFLEPLLIRQW
jgi:hypothetical protein